MIEKIEKSQGGPPQPRAVALTRKPAQLWLRPQRGVTTALSCDPEKEGSIEINRAAVDATRDRSEGLEYSGSG